MQITPYQIIVPLITLIVVFYAWNLVVKQHKTIWEATLWTIFWGMIAAIAIYPAFLDYFLRFTGIKNRENAVFITSIGILFFVVFYLVMRLEQLEQRQTRVIRHMALSNAGLKEDQKNKNQKPESNKSTTNN